MLPASAVQTRTHQENAMQNAAKKTDAKTQVSLSGEEQKLLEKMKARATKAISSMPPVMVIW
jgi:hypothetical protein